MMNLIFDADMLLFVSLLECEKPIHWGDDLWTLHCDMREATVYYNNFVKELTEKILNHYKYEGDYRLFMCLTDKEHENFRNTEVFADYKANRNGKRRPVCFHPMRKWIQENYVVYMEPHLEADDCAGLLTQELTEGDYVLVSGDKDFRALPGKFYDFMRDKYFETSEEDAERWHLYQTIMGDVTDGYRGAAGFGEVKTKRLLDTYGASWSTVLKAYKGDEEEALKNARLAYILHKKGDYDWKHGTIKLWEPNSK